jgi:hypothetical protein
VLAVGLIRDDLQAHPALARRRAVLLVDVDLAPAPGELRARTVAHRWRLLRVAKKQLGHRSALVLSCLRPPLNARAQWRLM